MKTSEPQNPVGPVMSVSVDIQIGLIPPDNGDAFHQAESEIGPGSRRGLIGNLIDQPSISILQLGPFLPESSQPGRSHFGQQVQGPQVVPGSPEQLDIRIR